MPTNCRLIIDEPAEGAWNMAVDEALLESVAEGGPATLRLYRWEPTLSLGYFQAYADRDSHEPSRTLPCVRRSSGGGALVHDREITYSLALPAAALAGRDTRALYCEAHRAVIDAIAALGGDTTRMTLCDPERESPPPIEPFLCFLRRADGDLLVSAPPPAAMDADPTPRRYKVTGSAQRRRRGALLQHGGVLLGQSPHAPELPGLTELGITEGCEPSRLLVRLTETMSNRLGLRCEAEGLSDTETKAAQRLRNDKHAAHAWVSRR